VAEGVEVEAGSADRGVGEGVAVGALVGVAVGKPVQAASSAPLSRIRARIDVRRFVFGPWQNRVSIPLIIVRDREGG
jgi:hypothetical protein